MVEFSILMIKEVKQGIIEKRNRLFPSKYNLRQKRYAQFAHEEK